MLAKWRSWFGMGRTGYGRRPPLILINGLAEQSESWYPNLPYWRKYFDIHLPNLLAYDGTALHRRIDDGLPIDVDYLVDQLHVYLDQFVQTPPFHIVSSSLGGKIAVEYAARYPDNVARLVLLCPSGISDEEKLPIVEGVRRSDKRSLISSVFCDPMVGDPKLLNYYEQQFADKRWRTGVLRTIRGTKDHRIVDRLPHVSQPTLLVVGAEDRVCDPQQSIDAAPLLPQGRLLVLPNCGHAPQIERADEVNKLVVEFLLQADPLPLPSPALVD